MRETLFFLPPPPLHPRSIFLSVALPPLATAHNYREWLCELVVSTGITYPHEITIRHFAGPRSGVTLFARCLLHAWKIEGKRERERERERGLVRLFSSRFFIYFFVFLLCPGFDFYSMINTRNQWATSGVGRWLLLSVLFLFFFFFSFFLMQMKFETIRWQCNNKLCDINEEVNFCLE